MYIRIAPVCFNTNYCGGESVSDNILSFHQCCFILSGISFVSSTRCLLCPTGMCICIYFRSNHYVFFCADIVVVCTLCNIYQKIKA